MTPEGKNPGCAGARFYRCALQVNPFAYLNRHGKKSAFADEDAYNEAIVDACLEQGIDAIGITDHYQVKTGRSLKKAAEKAGIVVFPGFEAVTKDGVHFLCLFDSSTSEADVERRIGQCQVVEGEGDSPIGQLDATEFLEASTQKWGAACIAAHVAGPGGLLKVLGGQSRMSAWKDANLRACCLPGPISDSPDNLRPIIRNTSADYRRPYPVAVLNAKDVCDPADLGRPGTSTLIKMTAPSRAGLAQAFLDPESRIRLDSDPEPGRHAEFTSISWVGGFLDGLSLPLNENLNVFVGGRGSGKSSVIESIRAALGLEPVGTDAASAHDELIKHVIGSGTQITLGLTVSAPSPRRYIIERLLPNAPVVKDEDGDSLELVPLDLVPNAEVYGQHEISEVAQDPEQRTRLLQRFLAPGAGEDDATELLDTVRESGRQLIEAIDRRDRLVEQLAALPALEETRKRFEASGIEEKLEAKTKHVEEEQILVRVRAEIDRAAGLAEDVRSALPLEREMVSAEGLKGLPNKRTLSPLKKVLGSLESDVKKAADLIERGASTAEATLQEAEGEWEAASEAVEAEYAEILRELQRDSIDGEELIKLRRQIAKLKPLDAQLTAADKQLKAAYEARRRAVTKLDEVRAARFRALEKAAKKVSRQLKGRVRVRVAFQGARGKLADLLKEQVGGRLKEATDLLLAKDDLSLSSLAKACREGTPALVDGYGLPATQAERIVDAGEPVFQAIEELDLPSTTQLELNVARTGESEEWRALEALSAGQKATAVLLLLLLESDAPLAIDQPEDDLDNRFISDEVVPRMKQEKRRRQFLFSTHNANIPVLGDAELILGLEASGDATDGNVEVPAENRGSIDVGSVRDLVESLLEGGKEAFELRRLKYGTV